VFIEAEPDQLEEYAQGLGLDMVQVHRKPARRPSGVLLIQAMTAGSELPGNQDCDMVLFDNLEPGSGKPWDWASVKPIAKERRIVLAGGLDPQNVYDAVRIVRPYAVDVSSGVELEPGVKDERLIREFISQVRRADMEAFK
jgi:phosphoribosylanthranilate isomerase